MYNDIFINHWLQIIIEGNISPSSKKIAIFSPVFKSKTYRQKTDNNINNLNL